MSAFENPLIKGFSIDNSLMVLQSFRYQLKKLADDPKKIQKQTSKRNFTK